jgi:ribose transport system ATP-binding protein
MALDNLSIDFTAGEVHALLGENGAGKSTLIKVISGAISPNKGEIWVDGNKFDRMTPFESRAKGIEVIYQEFNLVDSLSAAENICFGNRYGHLVDFAKMNEIARNIFSQFRIDLDPAAIVETLTPAQKQIVEIAKSISKKCKILIMDEPSAPLTVREVNTMFDVVRHLKAQGVTIIYISHRMEEIFEISDRVTVMRDGRYIDTLKTQETTRDELITLMVGRKLSANYPRKKNDSHDEALRIEHVSGNGLSDISLRVNKGEILGIGGLVGAGRTELARLIFGADKRTSGTIFIDGKKVKIENTSDAIRNGIGLIPEDRKAQGCFLDQTIEWNIAFNNIKGLSSSGIVNNGKVQKLAEEFRQKLNIKAVSTKQNVKTLSGGNQQKIVIAKTLASDSSVLMFDEPTRGIDVVAKQEIYHLMRALAEQGTGIIMISSDMEELLGMSDRILVLAEGKIAGELQKSEFSHRDKGAQNIYAH